MIHEYTNPPTVLVIMGSTRISRRNPVVAEWIIGLGRESTEIRYEMVDLGEWKLPMDDEPAIPATGHYVQDHTRAWSAKVAAAAGILIVTPQYNWGYPAPLKNALDHLYREWKGKPLAVITYGGHGGGKCAAQLHQVAEGLEMDIVATMPGLVMSKEIILGASFEPAHDLGSHVGEIKQALGELAAKIKAAQSIASRAAKSG
jgi:NAD(P)H-dependent FMN reductase